jgi:CheY-like chemotaxis protein
VYFVRTALEELDTQINLKHFVNGRQLLQELNNSKESLPNIVLMDLNMPVMDGKETLMSIRQCPTFNDLPVIILTTSKNIAEKNMCFEYGATNYITKPNNYSRYLEIIKKLKSEWIDESAYSHSYAKVS